MTLKNATKGIIEQPEFLVVYGPEGTGKTTFGSEAPDCICIGNEKGSHHLDITRVHTPTFDDLMLTIKELKEEKHGFKSVMVDSLDFVEAMIYDHLCKRDGKDDIEEYGFGKGYKLALPLWRDLLNRLHELHEERGMNVILVAHAKISTFKDPHLNDSYERYVLKLHQSQNVDVSGLIKESAQNVFFIKHETHVAKDGNNKTSAFGGNQPILYTERRPAFDAKNRFSLPSEIPLPKGRSWEAYAQARQAGPTSDPRKLVSECRGLIENLRDASLKQSIKEQLDAAVESEDLAKLQWVKNKLNEVANAAVN